MTRLKMAFDIVHADFRVVEVFDETGQYVASIYPANGGIKIVSRHLDTMVERGGGPSLSAAVIKFTRGKT